jgi:hypothetical protein
MISAASVIARNETLRRHFRVEEVADARPIVGDLFRRSFGHDMPSYPRHFVMWYLPDADEARKQAVAYIHQLAFHEVYLAGGMCVDSRAYRALPRELFAEVRDAGGLATMVTTESYDLLGEAPAVFGHVGEPRARQADYRSGAVDTGEEHIMVFWRKPLSPEEKQRLIAMVEAKGRF